MKKAVFMGSVRDFRTFLNTMRSWVNLSLITIHHWTNFSLSKGSARVDTTDLNKEAV
ncbi:hypothetical protein [Desulforamulus aquiferis]|uniref:Uncharacterized protein n=1 Tax=Desulforamulus aquiferis TaxID=1397668 RepID=A0AAW7ZDW7_9FIRM|nr:hypothetical protein [Desulforamulus aquiferis]MDO7787898.1 hypothetical protein [Desulforamulus aquiferis]